MIKVHAISGFLGAGKTTLIKHLAAALIENNEKVVILENEFGKVGIDGKLLELEGLSVYEISSGCLCCTLKNDFISTLNNIAENICPDRILIEPSGIFVLSEMFDIFRNPQINSRLSLCSALTVIDCNNFLKHRNRYGLFFENQINFADKLVLSKIKDIQEAKLVSIMEELQNINPSIEIFSDEWTTMSKTDFIGLLSTQNITPVLAESSTYDTESKSNNKLVKENTSSSTKHEKHNFTAFGLVGPFKCSESKLDKILSTLAFGSFGSLLRAKEHVDSENGILEFSYVDGNYKITQITGEIEPSVCFIGEGLKKTGITALFGK